MTEQEERLETARELLFRDKNFARECGVRPELVELDRAVTTMVIEDLHRNPSGMIHGGVLFTLADTTAGIAARADGRMYVTQNAGIQFLAGQRGGTLRAEGTVIHRGRSTCLIRVDITGENGRLLATAELTFFCVSPA